MTSLRVVITLYFSEKPVSTFRDHALTPARVTCISPQRQENAPQASILYYHAAKIGLRVEPMLR
jgi:hypothetical protein